MTDIVERLRICAKYDPDQAEAADEIERLRSEQVRLREIVRDLLSVMPVLPAAAKHIVGMENRYNSAITNARTALRENDQ